MRSGSGARGWLRFPRDFGALVRYHHDLSRVRHRFPLPPPMELHRAEELLGELGGDRVQLSDSRRDGAEP